MRQQVRLNALIKQLLEQADAPADLSEWRRQETRRAIRAPLEFRTHGGTTQFGYSMNVTQTTVCVSSKVELDIDELVEIRLGYTDDGWSSGVITRCTRALGGYQLAIQLD